MNRKRYIKIFLYFVSLRVSAAYQTDDSIAPPRKLYLSMSAQQGGIIFTPRMSTVVDNYYVGLDFRVGWQTDDFERNIYDCLFAYPQYGFGYYMGNMNRIILGNDEQSGFGKPAALYAFFASPIVRLNRLKISYDISLGLSYNFNVYDPQLQPFNILIGSKQNVYINLQLSSEFAVHKHTVLGVGVSFQHFSNGSYQKPNKGVNLLSGTLSYQAGLYKHHEKTYSRIPVPPYQRALEWQIYWSNGVRMLDADFDLDHPREAKRWYCAAISSAVMLQTNHHQKFGLGLDYFYFEWGRHLIDYRAQQQGLDATTRQRDNMALGAFLAHEAGYKKVWVITHLGFYVTNRVGDRPQNLWIYQRVGVKYHITPRFTAGVSIKAHLAIADNVEWTVGYVIGKSK